MKMARGCKPKNHAFDIINRKQNLSKIQGGKCIIFYTQAAIFAYGSTDDPMCDGLSNFYNKRKGEYKEN